MADNSQQVVVRRRPRTLALIAARVAELVRTVMDRETSAVEGALPLNRGFFRLEKMRQGNVVRKRNAARQQPRKER